MKSLSVLALVFCLFTLPVFAQKKKVAAKKKGLTSAQQKGADTMLEEWGEMWREVTATDASTYLYHTRSVDKLGEGSFQFWVKIIPKDKASYSADFSEMRRQRYANFDYTLNLWQCKCVEHQYRITDSLDYDAKGHTLDESKFPDSEWSTAVPDSVADALVARVCYVNYWSWK